MRMDAGLAGASEMNRAHAQVRRRTAPFDETRNDPNVAKPIAFRRSRGRPLRPALFCAACSAS
ncbi:hypothetical protein D1O30_18900 [Methylocystis hirsuta]|uniref:Uncharacterized protein n=1 Tax=Methylocystis hirsuta TaxID=369798 RepID=A0A3M9XU85_9HYPH|nr:hypothetical protein D1O30_18900 [Methylocystis hirsuta]